MILRLLLQTVSIAARQIWANKVRALLTTLGIVIGVSAVIATMGVAKGLEGVVLKEFSSFGANKVWIFPRRPDEQRERYSFRQIRLKRHEVDGILANAPSLKRLSPVMELNATVQAGDRIREFVSVQGIQPDWHEIESRFVTVGRTFGKTDEENRLQVCLVNDKGVQELALDSDPTGEVILVDGRRFTIVGVVETRAVSPMFGGGEAQTEIFVPFSTGEMMRPEPRMYVVAQSIAADAFEDVKAEVRMYMRRVRQLGPDEPDTFGVEAIDQVISGFKQVSAVMTFAAVGIGAISLLVGCVGIMNIMLVSVSERTREIGLRKAVGARPSVVLTQFLVEAVALCLVGGAIGLGLGYGAVMALKVGVQMMSQAYVPGWAILAAVGVSAGTGVVGGMFPAIKAARLDPIVALRHE